MARAIRFEASRTLAASRETVWPLAADTDRLNRAAGLPAVRYSATPRPGGGSTTIAEYRLGPLCLLRWTEEPFRWQVPRFYDVERRYHFGPIASFRGGLELTPTASNDTIARVWADLEPRGALGWLVIRIVGPLGIRQGLRQLDLFGKYFSGEIGSPFPNLLRGDLADESPEASSRRSSQAPWDGLARGSGAAAELIDRLRQHLEHSPDLDVLNMRPLVLADAWHADRLDVLSLFLHAAQAGVVVLHWDVLCPHCRTAKARYASLALLQPGAFCSSCATAYEADFDRNVELRFDVGTAIRRAQAGAWCEAGPMNTPHRLARQSIAPNGVGAFQGELEVGRYRVVSRQSSGSVTLDAGPQLAGALSTRVLSVYADRMGPGKLGLPPGPLSLSVVSHLSVPATVDIERADWPDTIATAALVSTLGTFRDLFSTDVLAAGQQVAIGRLTFLAASIAEPAALYAALGQGRAFKLVETCLRSAASVISAFHGAPGGALGETVLATFSSADDAVGAAITLQRSIAALVGDSGVDTARLMQIALHQGPCLAGTVADRLGYFGSTPSATLSLLGTARGGEMLLSSEVLADAQVRARLAAETAAQALEGPSFGELSLADGPFPFQRLQVTPRPPTELRQAS